MLYQSEKGEISVALLGDAMPTRRLVSFAEEPYLALVDLLRDADATLANLEGTVRRWDEGTPGITEGTYVTIPPVCLEDLKWMGVNLLTCANNHSFDFGEGGLMASIAHLDAAGIVHAGSGANLAEARAPGYLDTPNGRVAAIAMTATFRPWNRATPQRPDMGGRPGINPLAHSARYTVDSDAFAALRRISQGLGFERAKERDRRHFFGSHDIPDEAAEEIRLFGQTFVMGDEFAVETRVDAADMADNLRWIREARRQADWVVVSFHSHEFGGRGLMTARSRADIEELADFTREFAHAAIDAGADVFVGHGSHTLLGVEVYKGKPILYSTGNFIFQNETIPAFPAQAYSRFDLGMEATPADFLDARTENDTKGHPASPAFWQSAACICRLRKEGGGELRFYPIDLGYGRPRPQRGRPLLADEKVAATVLEGLQRLSRRYGTELDIDGRVGIVTL